MNNKKTSDSVMNLFRRARLSEGQGNWVDAIKSYQKILTARPNGRRIHHLIGKAFAQNEQLDLAVFHYKKAIQINPNDDQLRLELVRLLQKEQSFKAAISVCEEALSFSSDKFKFYKIIGDCYREIRQPNDAFSFYQRALENNNLPRFHLKIARILQKMGYFDDAILCLESSLNLSPSLVDSQYSIGEIFEQQEKYEEAILAYQRALDINSKHQPSLKSLKKLLKNYPSNPTSILSKEAEYIEVSKSQRKRVASDVGITDKGHQAKSKEDDSRELIRYGRSEGKSATVPFKKHFKRRGKSIQTDEAGFRHQFQFSEEAVGGYDESIKRNSVRVLILSILFAFYTVVIILLILMGILCDWSSFIHLSR